MSHEALRQPQFVTLEVVSPGKKSDSPGSRTKGKIPALANGSLHAIGSASYLGYSEDGIDKASLWELNRLGNRCGPSPSMNCLDVFKKSDESPSASPDNPSYIFTPTPGKGSPSFRSSRASSLSAFRPRVQGVQGRPVKRLSGIGSSAGSMLANVDIYRKTLRRAATLNRGSDDFNSSPETYERYDYRAVALRIYVGRSKNNWHPVSFHVPETEEGEFVEITAREAVALIREHLNMPQGDYTLYLFDRKYPGQRIKFKPDDRVDQYIATRSEWRIKRTGETEILGIVLPEGNREVIFKYDEETTVDEAIQEVKKQATELKDKELCLFCKSKVGFWLERSRKLNLYEFRERDRVEVRPTSREMLVRVYVPDVTSKFVIKAPIHFSPSELTSLINYQLQSRSQHLKFDRSQYGLWMPAYSTWMRNGTQLAGYPKVDLNHIMAQKATAELPPKEEPKKKKKGWKGMLNALSISEDIRKEVIKPVAEAPPPDCGVIYRLHHRHVPILLPTQRTTCGCRCCCRDNEHSLKGSISMCSIASMTSTLTSASSNSGRGHKAPNVASNWICGGLCTACCHPSCTCHMATNFRTKANPSVVAIHEDARTDELLMLLELECSTGWDCEMQLQTAARVVLDNQSPVWDYLEDLGKKEILHMVPKPISIMMTSSIDRLAHVCIECDPTVELIMLLPNWCRRMGLQPDDVKRVMHLVVASSVELDLEKSLIEQEVVHNSHILLEINQNHIQEYRNQVFDWNKTDTATDPSAINIWLEGDDHPRNVSFENGMLATGSLNKIVQKITPPSIISLTCHKTLLKTVLMTMHSFTSPLHFFDKLVERYHVPRWRFDTFATFEHGRTSLQKAVCMVLKIWTHLYPTAFEEHSRDSRRLINYVNCFCESVVAVDGYVHIATVIRANLNALGEGRRLRRIAEREAASPVPILLSGPPIKSGIFSYDPLEVSRQLTILDYSIFKKIKPTELLNQAWTRKDASQHASHVLMLSTRFNTLAMWVARQIMGGITVSARAEKIEFFIDVCENLLNLGNFASLMAIIAGLNNSAVQRLKHSFNRVKKSDRKKFEEYEKIMQPQNSYKNYREKLRADLQSPLMTPTSVVDEFDVDLGVAVSPTSMSEESGTFQDGIKPKLPYIGVHLLDLTYVEDGNPNVLRGQINVTKRILIQEIISEVLRYQDIPYNFIAVLEIKRLLPKLVLGSQSEKVAEQELFNLSLKLEPRGWDGESPLTKQ